MSKWIKAGYAETEVELGLLVSLLESWGIPSVARKTTGYDVAGLVFGPKDILVPEEFLEKATEVLQIEE